MQNKNHMRTALIDEVLRIEDYARENKLESFLNPNDPLRISHDDILRTFDIKERTEYRRRNSEKTEEILQYIRDNIIFVVPKGFRKI